MLFIVILEQLELRLNEGKYRIRNNRNNNDGNKDAVLMVFALCNKSRAVAVLNVVIRLNSWPNETKALSKDRDEKSDIACSISKRSKKER